MLRALTALYATVLALLLAAPAVARAAQPNFVLIQTDDSTLAQMEYMPITNRVIGGAGMTFDRYYVDDSICGPSRTSLLTGRYAHNTGVLNNRPEYGYDAFKQSESWANDLPTWLQSAGYETIHIGKFLNGYGDADPTELVPGWSQWETSFHADDTASYYGVTANVNGSIETVPTYVTDYETAQAVQQIERATEPFYLQLDYVAPHFDRAGAPGPTPAPRYARAFTGVNAPRTASYGVSKRTTPYFVRRLHPLTRHRRRWINQGWRNTLRTLQSVDAGVGQIVDALAASGKLDDTYVIFTSDNGFFFGQHRIVSGKYLPYEASTHLPLLIRGPGIAPGSWTESLAENVDLAPSIAELAGATPTLAPDGRSLVPLFERPRALSKRALLLEGYTGDDQPVHWDPHSNNASVTDYFGVLAGPWKYVRYGMGARELYNLREDPEELENLVHKEPRKAARLNRLTNRLQACQGPGCHVAINIR